MAMTAAPTSELRRAAAALFSRAVEALDAPRASDVRLLTIETRRRLLRRIAIRWGALVDEPAQVPASDVPTYPEALGPASAFGAVYEGLLDHAIERDGARLRSVRSGDRRSAGAHFTSPEVAADLVRRTLEPLVADASDPLRLRICDPSMGSGVFLATAATFIAEQGEVPLADVIETCLFGIDRDPLAVEAARYALAKMGGLRPSAELERRLVTGNAVVAPTGAPEELAREALDWSVAFPDVVSSGRGFDAIVGNPPWVAYAGRAAQPISRTLHRYFREQYPAFAGYRTLQAVFVSRSASALRSGGRLGLVVPTSMADLAGYAAARRAHDALAEADRALPDYGADAFDGVFQPAMGLVSTRREGTIESGRNDWDIARGELDELTRSILDAIEPLPRVPASAFGERGFQTYRGDVEKLASAPDERRTVGLRVGKDVRPFLAKAPSLFVDPADFARFRDADAWREVAVYVRQTARYPMAARADGTPFRNSVLAAFAVDGVDGEALLAYLNAWPIRFFHYMRFRDARQGMPQVKIGHLRSLPLPSAFCTAAPALTDIGCELGARNTGIEPERQASLDALVASLLGLSAAQRERIERFSREEGVMVRERTEPGSPDR